MTRFSYSKLHICSCVYNHVVFLSCANISCILKNRVSYAVALIVAAWWYIFHNTRLLLARKIVSTLPDNKINNRSCSKKPEKTRPSHANAMFPQDWSLSVATRLLPLHNQPYQLHRKIKLTLRQCVSSTQIYRYARLTNLNRNTNAAKSTILSATLNQKECDAVKQQHGKIQH